MEGATTPATPPVDTGTDVDAAAQLLGALFDQSDLILFRPIETWVEGRRKQSRVDYRKTCYQRATPRLIEATAKYLINAAADGHLNLFFGVCPRFGPKGKFDLAWQIRIVRCLWTDIDHVTVEEARAKIAEAGLPPPSIIVGSGNGAHCYWLLDQPYLIDDADDPPPVETEWIEKPNGRKQPRKYILEHGDKVYLDQQRHVSRLSAKAQHFQNVLAGIAKLCGGDNTIDVSRLLRLPGTLNRKNGRNGAEPIPTVLVECDSTRRYSLVQFEKFAVQSPEAERAAKIAAMPLPQVRKLSVSKGDKLAELIAASAVAPAGTRSEADFAVCCYAIRNGIGKEEVWSRVEQVGKFAEQGPRYFDRTWENAEYEVRATTFEKLNKKAEAKIKAPVSGSAVASGDDSIGMSPEAGDDGDARSDGNTIVVDSRTMPVADVLDRVTNTLLNAGTCFCRADQLVAVNDDIISPVLSSPELAGLLNHFVEFFFADEEDGEYKPLPPAYGSTWLNKRAERLRLPAITLFSRNPVYTDDWRLVTSGYDAKSGIYYAGPSVSPREGTEYLDALLQDFCFKKPADRTNYLGVLLTALLIPRFIGAKPAALFNGNQPELGKTILAQIIAILRDGHPTETANFNPNDEEFEKRLGAIVRRGVTTVIIDNAKCQGRTPRIESACLERCITDAILSFRLLGQSAEIRAENSHIFCITANTANVGRDIVTRSAVMNLFYEGDPERRTFTIQDPEGYAVEHRLTLLGELIGMVERWKASGMPLANVHSRFNKKGWGNIIGGILNACGEPDFLANAEAAATELDETRREFAELVAMLADHPQGTWMAAELVDYCKKHGLLLGDLGDGSARSLATKMGTIAGRFVAEPFDLAGDRTAVFHRQQDRKGNVYRVVLQDEVPNLRTFAEPLPNLEKMAGSAS